MAFCGTCAAVNDSELLTVALYLVKQPDPEPDALLAQDDKREYSRLASAAARESIVMLSATKDLGLANEIFRFAHDDTSGGSLRRLMHVEADNTDEQNWRDITKTTEGR